MARNPRADRSCLVQTPKSKTTLILRRSARIANQMKRPSRISRFPPSGSPNRGFIHSSGVSLSARSASSISFAWVVLPEVGSPTITKSVAFAFSDRTTGPTGARYCRATYSGVPGKALTLSDRKLEARVAAVDIRTTAGSGCMTGAMEPNDIIERTEVAAPSRRRMVPRDVACTSQGGTRPAGSAIYFLLTTGNDSRPHRIDTTEIWHYYSGAVVEIAVTDLDGLERHHLLGPACGGEPTAASDRPPGRMATSADDGRVQLGRMHGLARIRVGLLRTPLSPSEPSLAGSAGSCDEASVVPPGDTLRRAGPDPGYLSLSPKRQRVAPPGSTVATAVASRGVMRYTFHGGGPAEGAL